MERNLISGKEILTIYISKTGFITTQVDILIPIDKKLPEEKIFLSSIIHFFYFLQMGQVASCSNAHMKGKEDIFSSHFCLSLYFILIIHCLLEISKILAWFNSESMGMLVCRLILLFPPMF